MNAVVLAILSFSCGPLPAAEKLEFDFRKLEKAWSEVADEMTVIKGTIVKETRSTKRDDPHGVPVRETVCNFAMNGPERRRYEGHHGLKIEVLSPAYYFELSRKHSNEAFRISEFHRRNEPAWVHANLGTGITAYDHYVAEVMTSPWRILGYHEYDLRRVLPLPETTITAFAWDRENPQQVRLEFQCRKFHHKINKVVDVVLRLDSTNSWAIINSEYGYDAESKDRPIERFRFRSRTLYADAPLPGCRFRHPIGLERRIDSVPLGEGTLDTWKVTTFSHEVTPEEDFKLQSFGLREPPVVVPK